MTLQDQVCTLEQAIRLKGLGVVQQSLCGFTGKTIGDRLIAQCTIENQPQVWQHYIAAFSVAELGAMIPAENIEGTRRYTHPSSVATISAVEGAFYLVDRNSDGDAPLLNPDSDDWDRSGCIFDTEAQARAALLIHLLESGKTTADEVNTRLAS